MIAAVFIFSLLSSLFSTSALAASPEATFSFDGPGEVRTNSSYTVTLKLSTSESANALEGTVLYPATLELQGIDDGGSIVNFWVDRPQTSSPGSIHFSGVMPGGYLGENGTVFRLHFKTGGESAGEIRIQDERVLKNDGQGTAARVQSGSLKIVVSHTARETSNKEAKDATPPEPFMVTIVQDENLFDGAATAIFSTQDKGSGLDHYEVSENGEAFATAESPYVLKSTNLRSVVIHAIDRAGNVQEAIWKSPLSLAPLVGRVNNGILIGIVLALLIIIVFILRKRFYTHV